MMVHAGSNPNSNSLFPYDTRVPACYFRRYTRIEPCNHDGATYTVSGKTANDTHTLNCSHCLDRTTEKHSFENKTCTVCQVSSSVSTVSIYLSEAGKQGYTDGHYASTPRTEQVVTGTAITVPSPKVTYLPNGVTFAGWHIGTPSEVKSELGLTDMTFWLQDGEEVIQPNTTYTVNGDISITARYFNFAA